MPGDSNTFSSFQNIKKSDLSEVCDATAAPCWPFSVLGHTNGVVEQLKNVQKYKAVFFAVHRVGYIDIALAISNSQR